MSACAHSPTVALADRLDQVEAMPVYTIYREWHEGGPAR